MLVGGKFMGKFGLTKLFYARTKFTHRRVGKFTHMQTTKTRTHENDTDKHPSLKSTRSRPEKQEATTSEASRLNTEVEPRPQGKEELEW